MMKAKFLILVLLTLSAGTASAGNSDDYAGALQAWQRVLSTYVDDQGRTDFIALSKQPNDLQNLERYVSVIAEYGPDSNPEDFADANTVMAYHINTYNALAMHGVIDEGIPEAFDSFFKRAGFFKFRGVQIDGDKTNLYDYENKVIRPLNEPRAHFALNCMVKDCPRLPQEAFLAATLDEQLEAATLEFLNSDKHVRIDSDAKRIYVSAILDFYTEDFVSSGKPADLPEYINRFRKNLLPEGYKLKFLDYDWTINQQP